MSATLRRSVMTAMLGLGLLPSRAFGQACLAVENDKNAPIRTSAALVSTSSVPRREVDVKQIVSLTPAGVKALGDSPLAYVRVVRDKPLAEGGPELSFIRLFDETGVGAIGGDPRFETSFRFSREGVYFLYLHGARDFSWPRLPEIGKEVCPPFEVSVVSLKPEERPDFPGVRGQWWASYRVPTRLGLGAAVFVRRIGVAASAELTPTHLGSRSDPTNANPVTGEVDIRYRGARGYIGAGVRYFPDEEPDRDQFRVGVVAGEELPSFKGRPMWLLLNLRLEDRKKHVRGLRVEFAFRFDLWGSRP